MIHNLNAKIIYDLKVTHSCKIWEGTAEVQMMLYEVTRHFNDTEAGVGCQVR